jgi:hypothetical protein
MFEVKVISGTPNRMFTNNLKQGFNDNLKVKFTMIIDERTFVKEITWNLNSVKHYINECTYKCEKRRSRKA